MKYNPDDPSSPPTPSANSTKPGGKIESLLKESPEARRTVEEAKPTAALLTVKLRYKQPDGDTSKLLEFPVSDSGAKWARASTAYRFAATAASFGVLLRDSPHKGNATLDAVVELAEEAIDEDPNGYRAEFFELVRKAKALK